MDTIRVRLLLFAHYRDLAGTGERTIELPRGSTARQLVDRVRADGGGWARLPAAPAIALNEAFAPLAATLSDGDEVALLPPVAGG